jgi:hypothetical protein
LLFLLPLANLFNWPMERRNTMQNSNQPNQRVLSRMGARVLTPEEAAQVSGSQNQTFAFTHVINPDTTKD